MSFYSSIAHRAIQVYQKFSYQHFVKGLADLENQQRRKLRSTLEYLRPVLNDRANSFTYEEFRSKFPVTSYSEYRDFFNSEKNSINRTIPLVVRFQPTSGSTDNLKWIPYTRQLLKDFDSALGPWLYDFYSAQPEVLLGPHYWSLSWLPQDLRDQGVRLNDTELFPVWKKALLKQTMAVMKPVDLAGSNESSLFATLASLLDCKNLSFVSVWSPTYWLMLLKILENNTQALAMSLISGRWELYKSELTKVPCPYNPARGQELLKNSNPEKLWPKLKTLSCWTTSTSAVFANDIEKQFPYLKIVGKGLWATEGVVTIPFEGHELLAYQSHFFEFEEFETKKIFPSWELKQGQIVSPILTTTGGLIRYKLHDSLLVTGFNKKTPQLKFLGRTDGIDMVGEKLSNFKAIEILSKLGSLTQHQHSYLFAVKCEKDPHYCAVVDQVGSQSLAELGKYLENLLMDSFHYRLARELKQLGPAQVCVSEKPHEKYISLHLGRSVVLGNIKPESLCLVSRQELQENFL